MPLAIDAVRAAIFDRSIRALSIRQPWAHHILASGKDVENRGWPTERRGWVLIHAGVNESEDRDMIRRLSLPLGAIVGAARIVDCVSWHTSEWFTGPYGFVLIDALPIAPVPCRGALGFFRPEAATLAAVFAALEQAAA